MKQFKIFLILAVLLILATAVYLWYATSMDVEAADLESPPKLAAFHTFGFSVNVPESFSPQYLEASFMVPGNFQVNLIESRLNMPQMMMFIDSRSFAGDAPDSYETLALGRVNAN